MGLLGNFLNYRDKSNSHVKEISQNFVVADCSSCGNCESTEKYPSSVKIDTDIPLWGSVKPWSLQILCATGKTDWVHSVTEEKDTLAMAVDESASEWKSLVVDPTTGKSTTHRVMISNSSLNPPDEYLEFDDSTQDPLDRPSRVLILPDFIYIDHITPRSAKDDLKVVIKNINDARVNALKNPEPSDEIKGNNTGEQKAPNAPVLPTLGKSTIQKIPKLESGHKVYPSEDLACILLCSHRTRDKRCAVTSNILKKKFEAELRERDLYRDASDDRPNGVSLHFVSHVGGHKFAANCIVYTKSGKAIWLARVAPEHVAAIVEYCVLKGQVFPDLLRSAFNTNPIAW